MRSAKNKVEFGGGMFDRVWGQVAYPVWDEEALKELEPVWDQVQIWIGDRVSDQVWRDSV